MILGAELGKKRPASFREQVFILSSFYLHVMEMHTDIAVAQEV